MLKQICFISGLLLLAETSTESKCEGKTPIRLVSKEQECTLMSCAKNNPNCNYCWHWYLCVTEGDKRIFEKQWIKPK
jgi:hypothetical protein